MTGYHDQPCLGEQQQLMTIHMQVACRPSLGALNVDTIPANLAPYARIGKALKPEEWDTIQATTYQRAGYRCSYIHS